MRTSTVLVVVVAVALSFIVAVWAVSSSSDDTCDATGWWSGCSGCEHGTRGSCRWQKKKESAGTYSYSCVTKETLKANQKSNPSTYSSGSSSCPKDPADEPIVKGNVVTGDSKKRGAMAIPAKQVSTSYSVTVKNDKTIFKDDKGKTKTSTTVDRTAATGKLGKGPASYCGGDKKRDSEVSCTNKRVVSNPSDLNCQNFNSFQLSTVVDGFDGCNNMYGPTQIQCKSLVTSIWGQLLCWPYAVAGSGYCESFVDTVKAVCEAASCSPTWPWDVYSPPTPIIRPDNDAYCKSDVVEAPTISGSFAEQLGFTAALAAPLEPKHGFAAFFARKSGDFQNLDNAELFLSDTIHHVGELSAVYEVMYFAYYSDNGKTKRYEDPKINDDMTPNAIPFAGSSGSVAFRFNGIMQIDEGGCVYSQMGGAIEMELRINGTSYHYPDFRKRSVEDQSSVDEQSSSLTSLCLEAGRWPFEIVGYYDAAEVSELYLDVYFDKLGSPHGVPVYIYTDKTPIPSVLNSYYVYPDFCE